MQRDEILIQKPRNYGKSLWWEQVKKYQEMMSDMYMTSSSPPQLVIDDKYFKGNYHIGIDLGREDDMCTEGTYDYEKENLRNKVEQYEQNHLGATTERFIEMAREGGRSELLGNVVRQQEEKIHELSNALMRANDAVAARDEEIQRLLKSRSSWESSYYEVNRRYEAYKKKHAPKKLKVVKKTSKK